MTKPKEQQLSQKEMVLRISDYIMRLNDKESHDLNEIAVYTVEGAPITEDGAVSQPRYWNPRLGLVKGRFIDVIGWAVSQKEFYYSGEFRKNMESGDIGNIVKEEKYIELPENHTLDLLL